MIKELKVKFVALLDKVINDSTARSQKIKEQAFTEKIMSAIRQTDIKNVNNHVARSSYELGKMDPLSKMAMTKSFSGMDVSLYFSEHPEDWHPKRGGKRYGKAQAISWNHYRDSVTSDNLHGSIIDLALDHLNCPAGECLTVVALNEYGYGTILMQVRDFKVIKTSFGISIDDIVAEQVHEWTGTFHYQGAMHGYREEEAGDS
jgi:hypothetical protein